MESLVYEDSPLAEYLQGGWQEAPAGMTKPITDHVCSGEGEHDPNWPVQEPQNSDDVSDSTAADFAPRGTSKFQSRIRNKLPKPLDLKVSHQKAALGKIYDTCTVWSHLLSVTGSKS